MKLHVVLVRIVSWSDGFQRVVSGGAIFTFGYESLPQPDSQHIAAKKFNGY